MKKLVKTEAVNGGIAGTTNPNTKIKVVSQGGGKYLAWDYPDGLYKGKLYCMNMSYWHAKWVQMGTLNASQTTGTGQCPKRP